MTQGVIFCIEKATYIPYDVFRLRFRKYWNTEKFSVVHKTDWICMYILVIWWNSLFPREETEMGHGEFIESILGLNSGFDFFILFLCLRNIFRPNYLWVLNGWRADSLLLSPGIIPLFKKVGNFRHLCG